MTNVQSSPAAALGTAECPKVAQILYSGLGGHGGVAFSIANGDRGGRWLNRFGFMGIEPLLPAYAERASAAGIPHHYIPAVARRPWRSWPALHGWLEKVAPSAILLHSPTALLPCWSYAHRRGVPLIVVEHQPNHLKTRQDWLFSYLSMMLADRVVLLTESYGALMQQRLGSFFNCRKTSIIPNGVDVDFFAGADPFSGDSVRRIGMAARFSPTKLFALLIQAMIHLRDRVPEQKFLLTLAGAGEQWEAVKNSKEARNLGKSVKFEGVLSGAELANWYRSLDIYCHISAGETLSMSVIQAMAAGLPIIGSNVPGINNLLAEGVGQLVENEAEAVVNGVLRLIANPDGARDSGRRAHETAAFSYGQIRMFQAYDALLRAIAAER